MTLWNRVARRFIREIWSIGYRFESALAVRPRTKGEDLAAAFTNLTLLKPPPGSFWADPFPARVDGRTVIFFEEFDFRRNLGHLSAIEIGPDGPPRGHVRVMTAAHHLSYPFVHCHEGETFIVPEMSAANRVERFRCTRFPDRWESAGILLDDVDGVDPTLFQHAGLWWMFIGTSSRPGRPVIRDQLELYHAERPQGPWTPHPRNPVVQGLSGVRPAGSIIEHDGHLLRPAQGNSVRYGGSVQVQEITVLTPDLYEEQPAWAIGPTWAPGLIGTHTVNHAAGITVLDGLRSVLHFPGLR